MKKLIAMLLSVILFCTATGCSQANTPKGNGEDEPKIINYWSFMNEGEPVQLWMQTFIDDYMKDNPGSKVNVTWCGREVLTKLQARMAASVDEDFPDIVDQMNDTILDIQNKDGAFLALDDYLSESTYGYDGTFGDLFIPSLLDAGRGQDGKLYALPRESYVHAMFYNVKMFEQYQIKVPETWEDFMSACETLKKNGIAPIAFDGAFEEYVAWYYTRMCERVVGYDTLHAACAGEVKWSSDPAFLEIAKKIQQIVELGYIQENYQGTTWPGAQMLWVQGKAGMYSCGTWLPAELSESTPEEFKMDIFKFPSISGEKYPNYEEAWGNYWAVLKDAPHKESAVDFIKYTFQKKYEDAKSDLMIPSPLKEGKPVEELATQTQILSEAKTVGPIYANLFIHGNYYNNVYNKNVNDLMNGNVTAEQFIENMDKDTVTYYQNK